MTLSSRTEAASAVHSTRSVPVSGDPATLLTLRLLAAAALGVAAYIHVALAAEHGVTGPPVTMGQLFLVQAAACVGAAALLLWQDRDLFWLVAIVVATGSALPLLLSVYLPLPAIGPLPPIDEPVWYAEKLVSLAVELSVPALWLIRRIAPPMPVPPPSD